MKINLNLKKEFVSTFTIFMILYLVLIIYIGINIINYNYGLKIIYAAVFSLINSIIISSIFYVNNYLKVKLENNQAIKIIILILYILISFGVLLISILGSYLGFILQS